MTLKNMLLIVLSLLSPSQVIDLWLSTDFRLVPHAGRDTSVIYGADDIMAQLEESQVTVGTIRGSR